MPTFASSVCSLTFLLILCNQIPITLSQNNGAPIPSTPPIQPTAEQLNRHAYLSSEAPLTKTLTSTAALRSSYKTLLDYVEYIEGAVLYATNRTSQSIAQASNTSHLNDALTLTTCNHRDDGWARHLSPYFLVRGWEVPDTSCISDVYGTTPTEGVINPHYERSKRKPLTPTDLFQAVTRHSDLVNQTAARAAFAAGVSSNWTNPSRAREFVHEVRSQICNYDYTAFVKLDGKWFLAERITNEQRNVVLDVGKRNFLYEYIRPGDQPHPMELRNFQTDVVQEDASTVLGLFMGIVTGSAFSVIFPTDNLAVEDAIHLGEHQTQQADDATTPSNIAILAFPLVMNVVPVALIADVNTFGMLVYTILTDILTAVPLAIKGVEVLLVGRRYNDAAVTRITGANADPDPSDRTVKAAEVWVAECHAKGSLTAKGVILLLVAVAFMVGGVIAEFWARRWVIRRNAQKLLATAMGEGPGGHPTGVQATNDYYFEPVSASSQPTSLSAGTQPAYGNATAILLGAGVRERERFQVPVNRTGVPEPGVPEPGVPASSTGGRTPPSFGLGGGVGHKPKEK